MQVRRLILSWYVVVGLFLFAVGSYSFLLWRSVEVRRIPDVHHGLEDNYFVERIIDVKQLEEKIFDNKQFKQEMDVYCKNLSEREQLIDSSCRALWNHKLRNGEVTDVKKMWGFKNTHYGAITLQLEGDMTALFKPCTSSSEDITMELLGSQLDYILEFGQNAPVVSRRIPIYFFKSKTKGKIDEDILKETIDLCSVGDYLQGVMIGWRESISPVITPFRAKRSLPELYNFRIEAGMNLFKSQKVSTFHLFYYLIGIFRHGKDEFINTNTGDLVSLDLDRSNFKQDYNPRASHLNFTWCYSCYIEQKTYHTFDAVSKYSAYPISSLLQLALESDKIYPHIYKSKIGNLLNNRIEYILECITDCTEVYGRENVLLNEPPISPNEFIESFKLN